MSTQLIAARTSGIGTSATVVGGYTAPNLTTGTAITGLSFCNTVSTSVFVSVYIQNGINITFIAKNTVIIPGGSLNVADEGNRIVLQSGDQVVAVSNTPSSVDAIMSLTQIT